MRFRSTAWATAVTLSLSLPGAAGAQLTSTSPDCDFWMGINVLNQFNPQAQACAGAFEGNPAHFIDEIGDEIAALGWGPSSYLGKTDAGSNSGPFSSVGSGPNGTIVFDSPLTGDYVFVLKASNQFSFYLFRNLVGATQLTYSTLGTSVNGNDKAQGLSNASLYAVVPEPSTWVMLATGLLGLGWVARRRREGEAT